MIGPLPGRGSTTVPPSSPSLTQAEPPVTLHSGVHSIEVGRGPPGAGSTVEPVGADGLDAESVRPQACDPATR